MPTAVVTGGGGGGGIGRAISLELAGRGYLVYATDVDGDAAAKTAAEAGNGARFPRLTLRLLPLALGNARRKQRRYKKLIEAGKWP